MSFEQPYRTPAESDEVKYRKSAKIFLEYPSTDTTKVTGSKLDELTNELKKKEGTLIVFEHFFTKPIKDRPGSYKKHRTTMRVIPTEHPDYYGILRLFKYQRETGKKGMRDLGINEMTKDRVYVANIIKNGEICNLEPDDFSVV